MNYRSDDRARWLAAHILPLEPLVRGWLRRARLSGIEADDLLQEAYANIASLPSVEHISQPKAYLFRVVKSLILGHLRHAQVVAIESMAELGDLNLSIEEASPERILSGRQQLEQLVQAIDNLPAGCRRVFRLRKFEELSQKEIAARLQISESTVEKQLARALRLLLARVGNADASLTGAPKRPRGEPSSQSEQHEEA